MQTNLKQLELFSYYCTAYTVKPRRSAQCQKYALLFIVSVHCQIEEKPTCFRKYPFRIARPFNVDGPLPSDDSRRHSTERLTSARICRPHGANFPGITHAPKLLHLYITIFYSFYYFPHVAILLWTDHMFTRWYMIDRSFFFIEGKLSRRLTDSLLRREIFL